LLVGLVSSSCDDFLNVGAPSSKINAQFVYANDNNATSALVGIYAKMMTATSIANYSETMLGGISSDEFDYVVAYAEFFHNSLSTSNSDVSALWRSGYNLVYHANAVLEGLETASNISEPTKRKLKGEAKFIRAFCYFYLTNFWGDVPLITVTDYNATRFSDRMSRSEIYDQMLLDLQDALSLLDEAYDTNDRVRPNKFAAAALLSRVYLYNRKWAEAESHSTTIINNNTYSLENDLNKVFLISSSEVIWQLLPVSPGKNTDEGALFIPSPQSIPTRAVLSTHLLESFEENDKRKQNWTDKTVVNDIEYYYPFKYKIRSSLDVTEGNTVLRLAEQYLIRAEARAQLDDLPGAVSDLNIVRDRAGLESLALLDKQAILKAIEQERRVELFSEFGHRWFDLKRKPGFDNPAITRADEVLGLVKENWDASDALYPIPQNEIVRAPQLTQNPGY